ncbi:unnamed protein product [Ambrosiozyma monospora]|uniref:Unnamed protein product n=1 Tax=Ambrosiozyma monospora TaxID=43982 RepID=A0A9W6Z2C8_AMBMO|nr:unnamed protein product [Ambrosiozyma monospora]
MSNRVDLTKAEPEQIIQFKNQLNEELEHLQASHQALQTAKFKYKDCQRNVATVSANQDNEILVPLTASLYVPGKVKNSDEFLVDVGTGYFVAKNRKQSSEFFESRLKKLDQDGGKLTSLINEKLEAVQRVDNILRAKIMEQEHAKTQAAAKAK